MQRSQSPALAESSSSALQTTLSNSSPKCAAPHISDGVKGPEARQPVNNGSDQFVSSRSAYRLFPDPTSVQPSQRPSIPTGRTDNIAAKATSDAPRTSPSPDESQRDKMLPVPSKRRRSNDRSPGLYVSEVPASDRMCDGMFQELENSGTKMHVLANGPHLEDSRQPETFEESTHERSLGAPERPVLPTRSQQPTKTSTTAESPQLEQLTRVQQVQRLLARAADEHNSPSRNVSNTPRVTVARPLTSSASPSGSQSRVQNRPIGPGMRDTQRSASPLRKNDSPATSSPCRDVAGLGISFGSNVTTPDIAMFPVPGQLPAASTQSPGRQAVPRPHSPHGYTTSRPHSPYGKVLLRPSSPQRQYGIRSGSPHTESSASGSPRSHGQSPRINTVEGSIYSPPGMSSKRRIDPKLRVDTEVSRPQRVPQVTAQRQQTEPSRPHVSTARAQPKTQDRAAVRKSRLQKPLPATPPIEDLMPPAPPAELSDSSSSPGSPVQAPSPISPISPVSLIERNGTSDAASEPTIGSPVSAMTMIDSDIPPQIPLDAPSVPAIPKSITRKPITRTTPPSSGRSTPIIQQSSRHISKSPNTIATDANNGSSTRSSPKIDTSHLHRVVARSIEPSPKLSISPQPSLSPGQVEEAQRVAIKPVVRSVPDQSFHNRAEYVAPSIVDLSERQGEQRKRHEKLTMLNVSELGSAHTRPDPVSAKSGHSKAASIISVPSIFAMHERPESESPIAHKGVPRPDSDAMGSTPLLNGEQPKLSDIQKELKHEDALRDAESVPSADDRSSPRSGHTSGAATIKYRSDADRQPKSASPRRAIDEVNAPGPSPPSRQDNQQKSPSSRKSESDKKESSMTPSQYTARNADAGMSQNARPSKQALDNTKPHAKAVESSAVSSQDITASVLQIRSIDAQPAVSQSRRPTPETKLTAAQLGQTSAELPAALLPPSRPQQMPIRSNTMPQDLTFPKQDVVLGQPQTAKIPSYKSFFMQAGEPDDTEPVTFDFPVPRVSTSSTPITRDFAGHKSSMSSDRPYNSPLRSVKTMPALAETAIEHRKDSAEMHPLPVSVNAAKQSVESVRSRDQAEQNVNKDEPRAPPPLSQNQRRFSPGLTGNPVRLEEVDPSQHPSSGANQRPQTSGSDVSTSTRASVDRSEQQPTVAKYTAYNRTNARDSPMKNSPLSLMNRMNTVKDIPAGLSSPIPGEATPIAKIVEDELNLPVVQADQEQSVIAGSGSQREIGPGDEDQHDIQPAKGVFTGNTTTSGNRPSTSPSNRQTATAARGDRSTEQRPTTAGADRTEHKRTGPSLSLMPPLQVTRTIESGSSEQGSEDQSARPKARPESGLPPPVPRKDTIKNGIKRILNPKATTARKESISSVQTDPSILETNNGDKTTVTETASSHTSMASTTLSESVATSNAELARQLSEHSVDSTSIEAIRARVAGISQRTAKAVQPPEQDVKALLSVLEDLSKQSEAMHERYAGLRVERQKLSSSITQALKDNKPGPEYTNTLLDKHMALSAITSSLDICFAKLKSLDCRKEEAIAALVKQLNKKSVPASIRSKATSTKSIEKPSSVSTARPALKEKASVKTTNSGNEQKTLIAPAGRVTPDGKAPRDVGRSQAMGRTSPPRPQIKIVPEEDAHETYQSPKARVNATKIISRSITPDAAEQPVEKVITLLGKTGQADNNSRLVVTIGSAKQAKTPPPQRPLPAAPPTKRKSPVDSIHASVRSVASTPEDQDALTPKEDSSPNPLKKASNGRDVRVYAEDDFLDYYRSAPD